MGIKEMVLEMVRKVENNTILLVVEAKILGVDVVVVQNATNTMIDELILSDASWGEILIPIHTDRMLENDPDMCRFYFELFRRQGTRCRKFGLRGTARKFELIASIYGQRLLKHRDQGVEYALN